MRPEWSSEGASSRACRRPSSPRRPPRPGCRKPGVVEMHVSVDDARKDDPIARVEDSCAVAAAWLHDLFDPTARDEDVGEALAFRQDDAPAADREIAQADRMRKSCAPSHRTR